jgi:hypothetical protein
VTYKLQDTAGIYELNFPVKVKGEVLPITVTERVKV